MARGRSLVGTAFFALCLVSAMQLLEPRDMPFGVTGPSPVVSAIQHKDPDALDLKNYSSEADLIQAAERGDIYGGYIPGAVCRHARHRSGEELLRRDLCARRL